jgi:hypothetical protein
VIILQGFISFCNLQISRHSQDPKMLIYTATLLNNYHGAKVEENMKGRQLDYFPSFSSPSLSSFKSSGELVLDSTGSCPCIIAC